MATDRPTGTIAQAARILFWLALVFAFVMAILPQPPAIPGNPGDKVQHILAFAVLTALLVTGYPSLPLWRAALTMALFGALIEVTQMIPALHRTADTADWLADMGAVAAILLVAAVWRRLIVRRH